MRMLYYEGSLLGEVQYGWNWALQHIRNRFRGTCRVSRTVLGEVNFEMQTSGTLSVLEFVEGGGEG